jgi:hypothetical protein
VPAKNHNCNARKSIATVMAITIWVIGRYEITGTVLLPYGAFFCFSFQQILATRSRRFSSRRLLYA